MMSEKNSQNLSPAVNQTVRKSTTKVTVSTKVIPHDESKINVDLPKTSTPKEVQLKHVKNVGRSKISSNTKSEVLTTSKIKKTVKKSDNKISRTYSDYSSGYCDSDSDYSYRSHVTPSRGNIYPNMSRPGIRSAGSSIAAFSDISSDDEAYKKTIQTKNENQIKQFFHFGSDIRKNESKNIGENLSSYGHESNTTLNDFKTIQLKHSYGLDNDFSDDDDFREHTENSSKFDESSVLSRIVTIITKITMLESIFKITRWLWFHMWKALYLSICYILLLDTLIISKFARLRRWKNLFFLLLLLLLPLLLLGYFISDGTISNPTHTVTTSLSTSYSILSSFWSRESLEKDHKGFMESLYNVLHLETIGSILYNWSLPLWVMFSFKAKDSSETYKQETRVPDIPHSVSIDSTATHLTTDQIKTLVHEVFRQEIKEWTLQNQNFISTEKKETNENIDVVEKLQFELNNIFHHSKNLEMDVTKMKSTISSEGNKNEETTGRLNVLENKLEEVEKRIHTVEDILVAMRNCCHNQSEYIATAEKHIATLLLKIMSDDQTKSPFAAFGNWLKSRFVGKDELENYVGAMADRVTTDLSESLKQRAEFVAKAAAAAIVAESMTSAKDTLYKSQESILLTNDTKTCASEEKVKKIVREAILLYDADKTGLVDYALESSGGSIFSTRCSETYHTGTAQITVFGIPVWYSSNSPRTVIQPEVHPGQCWAFKGTQGYLVIKLSVPIRPTAFSMEHISRKLSLTGSIDSAPKEFMVLGLNNEADLEGKLLGTYTYNKNGDPLQYFYVKDPEPDIFSMIELRILSNHGHMDYTCLYRFRVHGKQQ